MVNLNEVVVEWQTPTGGLGLGFFYFDATNPIIAAQRTSLQQLLVDCAFQLADTTSWEIRTTGKQIQAETGTLTGFWSDTTAHIGDGSGGVQMADATQLLLQWISTDIVAGRRVRGRNFLPGIGMGANNAGEPSPAVVASLASAAAAFAGRGQGFGVWSRPAPGRNGSHHTAVQGTAWSEFAVQRRRRF